jgi:hypothetical protein
MKANDRNAIFLEDEKLSVNVCAADNLTEVDAGAG